MSTGLQPWVYDTIQILHSHYETFAFVKAVMVEFSTHNTIKSSLIIIDSLLITHLLTWRFANNLIKGKMMKEKWKRERNGMEFWSCVFVSMTWFWRWRVTGLFCRPPVPHRCTSRGRCTLWALWRSSRLCRSSWCRSYLAAGWVGNTSSWMTAQTGRREKALALFNANKIN